MTNCPLCSDILLRHVRSGHTYWLCRRCRVEIGEVRGQLTKALGNCSHPLTMLANHPASSSSAGLPHLTPKAPH